MCDRVPARTILVLGAVVVAGPLLAAVLLDRGHPTWQAVGLGVLIQVAGVLLVPASGRGATAQPSGWRTPAFPGYSSSSWSGQSGRAAPAA